MSASLRRPGTRPRMSSPISCTSSAFSTPAFTACTISPASAMQVGLWSTKTAAWPSSAGSTSAAVGLALPTRARWVPGATSEALNSGVVLFVAPTMTPAPASALATSSPRPTTRTSRNSHSAVSARTCASDCGPRPNTVRTSASGRASRRIETALPAAVRTRVTAWASSVAIGRPVEISNAVSEPCRRSRPRPAFAGTTLMTFTVKMSNAGSAPEMKYESAPSPRPTCARIGAMASPPDTIANADSTASNTSRGSSASTSAALKWRGSDIRLFSDGGQRLEQVHRLLAARDRELEDEVVDTELGGTPEIRDDVGAQASEWRPARDRELAGLPPGLGGRVRHLRRVVRDLQAGAHRDRDLVAAPPRFRGLAPELADRRLELLEGQRVADPPVAEPDRAPQRRLRRAAHQHREVAAVVRPGREVEALGLAVPAGAHDREVLVRYARPLPVRHDHELRLRLEPAEPDAGDHAAAGERVRGGQHLRQQQRVPVRHDQDRGADLDARGDARDVGHRRHRLEERGAEGLEARRRDDDVVGDPDRVEAERLAELGGAPDVRGVGERAVRRQDDADLDALHES